MRSILYFSRVLLVIGLGLFLGGCGGSVTGSDELEKKHPDVQAAKTLIKQQDLAGAAAHLYRLLQEEPDMAYAHMQLGFVFQTQQEPVKALYHFQRYLEQRPDTENAEVIREVVADELKRLARRVEGGGAGNSSDATVAALEARLRETQRALARSKVELQQMALRTGDAGSEAPVGWAQEKLDLLAEIARLQAGTSPEAPGQAVSGDIGGGPGSIYTVKRGDTLSGISKNVYGRSADWQKIFEANRDQLPSTDRLKPGMVLVIP